jgi:hypothetical protein
VADTALLTRYIQLQALKAGVDPDLAVAVALQESSLNPGAVGDNGKSLGLFQLQPAAAIDAGIDPAQRGTIRQNVLGGVRYLKQQLDREGGNVERALSRYNRGTPTYQGIGDPRYVEQVMQHYPQDQQPPPRSLLRRVASAVSPAPADAAAPAGPPGALRPADRTALEQRRQLLMEERARLTGTPSASPPSIPSRPEPGADPRQGYEVDVRLNPPGLQMPAPPPRSPALAQEQAEAAQQPWWQRAAQAFGAASPEIEALDIRAQARAQAEMSPAERAELRRLEGQAGTGANVGELVGQTIGSAVMPGAGTALGGTVGAVIGKTAETLLQEGRLPSWKEIGTEAAWSLLPEAAESLGRLGLRTIARGTRGGQIIRFDEAARRARVLPEVFEAQTREQVGTAFEAVRQSGVQLDTTALRQEIQSLRPGKYADVMAELRRMDRHMKTGNRYQQLFQNLRQTGGVQVTGMPIGDLQQLRSGLRVRIDQLEHTEARQLLRDVQRAVDDAVDQGIARGRTAAGQTPEQLQQARREWARVRASEDMGDLIERTITTTPDLSMASFNLRQFADAMRRNTGDLAQSVNRSLDQVPGARARFLREMDDIARLYQTAELPMADVFGIWRMPGFAMVRQWISQAMLSDTGRQLFRQAMLEGRGRVSLNGLAAAVNAGRREVGLELLVIPEREGDLPPSAPAPTQGPGG